MTYYNNYLPEGYKMRNVIKASIISSLCINVAYAEGIKLKSHSFDEIIKQNRTLETVEKEMFDFDDMDANHIKWIPSHDLPNQKLVLNFKELYDKNLLNKKLNIKSGEKPWSSSFFPAWYGGASGRWQKGNFLNAMKTLFGNGSHKSDKVLKEITEASYGKKSAKKYITKISATEKYDLLVGDYHFTSTIIEGMMRGHKSGSILGKLPKAWDGYCNGVSAAGLLHKEPFRQVDVINKDGHKISFHPNDIKALLSLAYYNVDGYFRIGDRCNLSSSKAKTINGRIASKACRDMNPGSLVVALTNRIGIAGTSFVVDKNRFNSVSNHPVGSTKVTTLGTPYKISRRQFPYASKNTKFLADVRIDMEIGSTTEKYKDASKLNPRAGRGYYYKVGFKPEYISYFATIELDRELNILGGEWKGGKKQAPDFIWFGEKPFTVDQKYTSNIYNYKGIQLKKQIEDYGKLYCGDNEDCDRLRVNPAISWAVIKKLHEKSIQTGPRIPVLNLNNESLNLPAHSKKFYDLYPSVTGKLTILSNFNKGKKVELLGYIHGNDAKFIDEIKVYAYKNAYDRRPKKVGSFNFKRKYYSRKDGRKHFEISKRLRTGKYQYLKLKAYKRGKEIGRTVLKLK